MGSAQAKKTPSSKGTFARIREAVAGDATFTRRTVVYAMLGGAFAIVAGRLVYLQAFESGNLATDAAIERTANIVLPHRRGSIYDRDGKILATSVDAVTIAAHPNQIHDPNAVANIMASVLGGSNTQYAELLSRDTTYVYVKKRIDPDVAQLLKDAIKAENLVRGDNGRDLIVGIEYISDSRRVYPMGSVGGNVIGCVGDDGHGLTGLEKQYEEVLSGTDGHLREERGLYGDPIVGGASERVDPIDGADIVVALDMDIQRVAEEKVVETLGVWNGTDGCCIVMMPETGEILACASTPFLDPGDIATAKAEAFTSKCMTFSYEPGSTVKPLTASMAIDLGIATPDTEYWAPAYIQVGADYVGDADQRNYEMSMSLTNMLERSSNVGAVLCAESVGKEYFSEYLARYGIGSVTGIDYPGEERGIVPKLEDYPPSWQAMAFGQSFAVPPIQIARAIGAIANEGILMTPHFLLQVNGVDVQPRVGERVVTTAVADQVSRMMYNVCEYGYGYPARVEGYNISGKTGTAERLNPETGRYYTDRYTSSFIGFGPTEDPKLLVYLVLDCVYDEGAEVAAVPWSTIMQTALEKLQIPPSY